MNQPHEQHDQLWAEFLAMFRSAIGSSLRDQIARQSRVNPNVSLDRIKEIEIDHWAQRLQRLADEADEEEKFRQRDMWEALIEALPELI